MKYFFAHDHDWGYLTMPFGRGFAPNALPTEPPRDPETQPSAGQSGQPPPKDRMVFKWQSPCTNSMVYSTELQKVMPGTYDANCFRGDRVTLKKEPGEYRIIFLGGSTVEDRQSDAEMMTAQFKSALRLAVPGGSRSSMPPCRVR